MRNPSFSIRLMTAPALPAFTVSGFKIVNVLSIPFSIFSRAGLFRRQTWHSCLLERELSPRLHTRLQHGVRLQARLHRVTDLGRTLHDVNSPGFHCRHLFTRCSFTTGN